MRPGTLWPALFLACVALRLGVSTQMPALGLAGAALALLASVPLPRPVPPTPGLSFIVFASGALLGYLALGDLAPIGSWPADFPLAGGVCLAVMTVLLWVHFAGSAIEGDASPPGAPVQTVLTGGIPLLVLLPLPQGSSGYALALAPVGLVLALTVLWAGRGSVVLRLALLLPALALAPALTAPLGELPKPLLRLLWRLAPDPATQRIGYDPEQSLRALAFLRPSNRTVLRVHVSGAMPGYLAGNRLDSLDSRTWMWRSAPAPRLQALPARGDGLNWYAAPGRRGAPSWRGRVEALRTGGVLFLPPDTLAIGAPGGVPQATAQGVLSLGEGDDQAWDYVTEGAPLATLGIRHSPRLLHLPQVWDERLQHAAEQLRGPDAAGTARNVSAHFRARDYTLQTRLNPRQPLHDFLLAGKPAHCFWYATGATLMLRAAGVPARLVSGYRISERLAGNVWIVRERDAHAWTEWRDERGRWHTLDATPPSYEKFLEEHRSGEWRRLGDLAAAAIAGLRGVFMLSDTVQQVLIGISFAGLIALFVREYRRLHRAANPVHTERAGAQRLWRRFLRLTGLPAHSHWAAADYLEHLPAHWSAERTRAVTRFLHAYGLARFCPPPARLDLLEEHLRTLRKLR